MGKGSCSGCKCLRRKCRPGCIFAPYFPPTEPNKFITIHRIFGAGNLTKILSDLPPEHRNNAVDALYYEAEARLRDPIHGCIGLIPVLQNRIHEIKQELTAAKINLTKYTANKSVVIPSAGPPPDHFMMSPGYQQVLNPDMVGINFDGPSWWNTDSPDRFNPVEIGIGSGSGRPNFDGDENMELLLLEPEIIPQPPPADHEAPGN